MQSILGKGLLVSKGFMSRVILPIRFRLTRRSDSPANPTQNVDRISRLNWAGLIETKHSTDIE